MEDGACIAVCLQLAGKENVSKALRAFEKIRYDRVRATQKTGETTRDVSCCYSICSDLPLTLCVVEMAQGQLG